MNHPTRQSISRNIIATITQRLGRRYEHLEKHLEDAPIQVLNDLSRLVRDFDEQLTSERKEGRKDVALRGRFP